MPRNGSGAYNPPGTDFPAVPSTLIESTKYNNVITDIGTAISGSISADGQTTVTQNIPMNSKKFTGLAAGGAAGDSVRYEQAGSVAMVETVAAATKATPVDADVLPIADSATSNTLKNLTWANLKATVIALVRTGSLNSLILPASTTANRDVSPAVGYLRYNTDLQQYEGYGSAGWGKIGGGTSGGSTDAAVYENDALVTTSYTLGQASLISGATVTIATPGVVTLTGHGFIANQPVFFQTTGALPTGLSVDTAYYVLSSGLTADAFQLSLTSGGAAINTTGTQSGVHSCGKIKNGVSAGPWGPETGAVWTVPTGARHIIV